MSYRGNYNEAPPLGQYEPFKSTPTPPPAPAPQPQSDSDGQQGGSK